MAKQIGLVKYNGTMGGVRHFKIKGLEGDFAGLIGGPSAEQIAKDPAFKRTRENMSEFGGSATAGRAVRVGLSSVIKQMSDPFITGRLTATMKQINLADTAGVRGQRGIFITANQSYLENFDFNRSESVDSIFQAPYTLTNTVGRDSASFTVSAFTPTNYINAPAGATHFRLLNAISVVSDYKYNSTFRKYEPVDPTLNETGDVEYSAYLDLSVDTSDLTITTTLAGTPSSDVSVLNCIGIEFYQQVGSTYYLFASGNVMMIKDVF